MASATYGHLPNRRASLLGYRGKSVCDRLIYDCYLKAERLGVKPTLCES